MELQQDDLLGYDYDPQTPLPVIGTQENTSLQKDPVSQKILVSFRGTRMEENLFQAGTKNLSGWNIQRKQRRHSASSVEPLTVR